MTSSKPTSSPSKTEEPPDTSPSCTASATRKYYDSPETDNFYHTIWGGSNISIGIYLSANDSIAEASQRTVEHMAAAAGPITSSTRVIDLGAGYGGSARYLARTYGCHVTCLNLSPVQNERNRQKCREQGLESIVKVVEGSFEAIPAPEGSFDLVWSQDAFLHSGNREKVLDEADRVLVKQGGKIVFTDLLEEEDADPGALTMVLKRLPVEHFATANFYLEEMRRRGFQDTRHQDLTPHLATHYEKALQDFHRFETEVRNGDRNGEVTKEFSATTKSGMNYGVKAVRDKSLAWGCFTFRR